jgi:hypothetical protein
VAGTVSAALTSFILKPGTTGARPATLCAHNAPVEEPAARSGRSENDTATMPHITDQTPADTDLSRRLSELAASLRELASRRTVDETLQLAVDRATELIPGCDYADVMFIGPGGTTTPVSTDPVAVALDELQAETGEGPCLAAARETARVVVHDLDHDERWPAFGPRAAELGVFSALSYQLFLLRNEGDRLGALNLFGTHPYAFDRDAVAIGEVFAAHCAAVLASAIAQDGATAALASRDVIGQAKGILMASHGVDANEAFDLLRRASQRQHAKLRDVAARVATTRRLDRS